MSTVSAGVRSEKTIFGHPAGLFLLFFTEMWERFSYYGMAAVLVLYMAGDAQHPESSLIMRAQTGAVHVLGFAGLQHAIEAVYGPLDIQALASEILRVIHGVRLFDSAVRRNAGGQDFGAAQERDYRRGADGDRTVYC